MITTYDLRDSGSQQALVDELRATGFAVELGAGDDGEALMMVTHRLQEVGRLDGLVYAAAPPADIVTTDVPRAARPFAAAPEPSEETGPGHRSDIA